ncbi:TIGR00295 family protein [Methanobrevibacter sp.]
MEIELLKKEHTPDNVIEHCIAVCRKAMKIAANFDNADVDLIRKGALLHDIGRSKTHDITHAIEGVKIAEKYGYDQDVLNIIERHIGAGITESESVGLGLPKKSYVPQTLEEKIVAHADNLVSGSEEVDIDFVIRKWKRRIKDSEDNIERLIELDNELIKTFEE